MRIAPVSVFNINNKKINNNVLQTSSSYNNELKTDKFEFKKSPSFAQKNLHSLPASPGVSYSLDMGEEIYGRDDRVFAEVAEGLWDVYDADIKDMVCLCSKKRLFGNVKDNERTNENYRRLKVFVDKARKEVAWANKVVESYENINADELEEMIAAKSLLTKRFFNPIIEEQSENKEENKEIEVPNGILISGNTDEETSELFKWFKDQCSDPNVNISFETIEYDDFSADEFFNELRQALVESEEIYKATGRRTVINLRYMDNLFVDDSEEAEDYISMFKNIVEKAQKKYHTTLFVMAYGDMGKVVDTALLAEQRFPIQIVYNRARHTDEENETFEKAQAIIEKYNMQEATFFDRYAKKFPLERKERQYEDPNEVRIDEGLMW